MKKAGPSNTPPFCSGLATDELPSIILSNLSHAFIHAALIKLSETNIIFISNNNKSLRVGGGVVAKREWEEDKRW